ncbi:Arabinose 5-phosphate isomerase [Candidatus Sumerlaea chitinivorans]|uniref:Arabinose 5-phosphate isomerase n=1 Tax=Sumerlaea chitinivorans TaxID=2250252 RepID=A0A2Z4Y1K9_SUMC1|nr:Arabinose 5-phosphate isomerase [Candidatus Sumerlaea chitinivorans]
MNDQLSEATLKRAQQVLRDEADALLRLADRIGEPFHAAVEAILACKGRVVLTGMGKHGIVARKIAATLASTGTPAFYMHPAEGAHGDLGMISSDDLVIAVSNSGNTDEVLGCIPYFKRNHNLLIAMTGRLDSELARHADIVLDIGVEREVCPLNLAPTTSTTVALAMGDALAVVLLERRGFNAEDFALRHPSGTLGKRLLLKVADLIKPDRNPMISQDARFEEAIEEITSKQCGAVSVVDAEGRLVGIITDGDLRRIFQREARQGTRTVAEVLNRPVSALMTRNPMFVSKETLAAKALNMMEDGPRKIFVLPVVDDAKRPIGMLHLHDLVSAGV